MVDAMKYTIILYMYLYALKQTMEAMHICNTLYTLYTFFVFTYTYNSTFPFLWFK